MGRGASHLWTLFSLSISSFSKVMKTNKKYKVWILAVCKKSQKYGVMWRLRWKRVSLSNRPRARYLWTFSFLYKFLCKRNDSKQEAPSMEISSVQKSLKIWSSMTYEVIESIIEHSLAAKHVWAFTVLICSFRRHCLFLLLKCFNQK